MEEYEANYMSSNGLENHESFKGNLEELKNWIQNKIGEYDVVKTLNLLLAKDGSGRIHIKNNVDIDNIK